MKDKILEAFKKLGFKLEYIEGAGYDFTYEGTHMLLEYNEDDENFLNISIPSVCEYDENKMAENCALMFKVNSTLKYVKAYYVGTDLWLFYEREVYGEEDFMTIIPLMILHLDAALKFTREAIDDIANMAAEVNSEGDEINDEDKDEEEAENEDNNEK